MKLRRLQISFLIFAAALILGFSVAGASGFRVLSLFARKSFQHTSGPGIYPAPYVFHK